jgi:uncharacterized membrane protein
LFVSLSHSEKRFLEAALILNGLCLGLFVVRILVTGFARFWFIPENLLLAWLGFFFGWMLVRYLKDNSWKSWPAVLFSLLWLVFVPNCWYVMTDFVHMTYTAEISQLFDIALFTSLVASGFMAGFASLVLVHKQLLRHFGHGLSTLIVLGVIVFASFSIYLGRDLRWNSIDIIANPGGLALNVSDRLIDPFGRPRMVNVTSLFFVTITAGYWAVWRLAKPRN